MPKTNYGGATYAGHTGIVENAAGELSELDPSRNVDGSVVDGYESEDRDLKDEDRPEVQQADPNGVHPIAEPTEDEQPEDDSDDSGDKANGEEESSPGSSSQTSDVKRDSSPAKTEQGNRKPARTTGNR